jgi:hypothetical protein
VTKPQTGLEIPDQQPVSILSGLWRRKRANQTEPQRAPVDCVSHSSYHLVFCLREPSGFRRDHDNPAKLFSCTRQRNLQQVNRLQLALTGFLPSPSSPIGALGLAGTEFS